MWYRKSISKYLVTGFLCLCLLLVLFWGYLHLWSTPTNTSSQAHATISGTIQVTVPVNTRTTISEPTASTSLAGWKLLFDDEFNGPNLDPNKWNIENSSSGGYQDCCLGYGKQYFTPQALSFLNGSLHITTQKQKMGNFAYTSGAITTENKLNFLYGRIDIRAKLPKTQGLWPAFWLLPANAFNAIAPFEIDMMEFQGRSPTIVYMTNHWGKQQIQNTYEGSDFSQEYHDFSLIWNAHSITWYIDGIERFATTQGVASQKMYLIINSSIGGKWAGLPGTSTVLPQYLDLDYVRIYQTGTK